MRKRNRACRTLVAATALLAIGLVAGNAQALPLPFITGGLSFSDGFDTLSASASAVVHDLNTVDVQTVANTSGSGTGNFAGAPATGTAFDIQISPFVPGTAFTIVIAGDTFTFTDLSISNLVRTALACTGPPNGTCTDTLVFNERGSVTDSLGNFQASQFTGFWTATGSCNEDGANIACSGNKTANWSKSLSATGTPVQSPEPGSLILLGVGLLGLVAYRRRAR